MLEDSLKTPDFARFVETAMRLAVHMALNDPPIQIGVISLQERAKKEDIKEQFEFWMYNKQDYYCVDGFPSEGDPCVVVLPPPYRQGYVYQGIKPAVIGLDNKQLTDELKEHVRLKQEQLLERLKMKRQTSLVRDNIEERVEEQIIERIDSLNERDFDAPQIDDISEIQDSSVLQPVNEDLNSQPTLDVEPVYEQKQEPETDADDEATVLKSSVRTFMKSNKENAQQFQTNVDSKLKVYYDAYVTSKNNGKSKYFNEQSRDKKEVIREEIMRLNENRKSQLLKTQSLKQELTQSRWYDMPKKVTEKIETPYSNMSVIADYHNQKNNVEFKQELHRKISNCKNVLQKVQQQPFGSGVRPRSPFEKIENVYKKVGGQRFQTLDRVSSQQTAGRNVPQKKQSDLISSMREQHQLKMNTIQKRLEQEKNNMRSRITSRSRSPMVREICDYNKKGATAKTQKRQSTIQFDSSSSSEDDFRSITRADQKYKRSKDKTFVVSPKPIVSYRGGPLSSAVGTSTLQKNVGLRRTMECQGGFSKRPMTFGAALPSASQLGNLDLDWDAVILPQFTDSIPSYSQVTAYFRALESQYPFLVQSVDTIGTTIQSNSLIVAECSLYSDTSFPSKYQLPPIEQLPLLDDRSVLVIPVAHNANSYSAETLTIASISKLIYDVLRGDQQSINILSQSRIYVIPNVNPDGREYLLGQYLADEDVVDIETFTKNRNTIANSCKTNLNRGTSLRNNYGYQWAIDNEGSSPVVCNAQFRGDSAFSEKETAALKNFIEITLGKKVDYLFMVESAFLQEALVVPFSYDENYQNNQFVKNNNYKKAFTLAYEYQTSLGLEVGNMARVYETRQNGAPEDYFQFELSTKVFTLWVAPFETLIPTYFLSPQDMADLYEQSNPVFQYTFAKMVPHFDITPSIAFGCYKKASIPCRGLDSTQNTVVYFAQLIKVTNSGLLSAFGNVNLILDLKDKPLKLHSAYGREQTATSEFRDAAVNHVGDDHFQLHLPSMTMQGQKQMQYYLIFEGSVDNALGKQQTQMKMTYNSGNNYQSLVLHTDTQTAYDHIEWESDNHTVAYIMTYMIFVLWIVWVGITAILYVLQNNNNIFKINLQREDDEIRAPINPDIEMVPINKSNPRKKTGAKQKTFDDDIMVSDRDNELIGGIFDSSSKKFILDTNYDSIHSNPDYNSICSTQRSLMTSSRVSVKKGSKPPKAEVKEERKKEKKQSKRRRESGLSKITEEDKNLEISQIVSRKEDMFEVSSKKKPTVESSPSQPKNRPHDHSFEAPDVSVISISKNKSQFVEDGEESLDLDAMPRRRQTVLFSDK